MSILLRLIRRPLTLGHAVVLVAVVAVAGGGAFAIASIPAPGGVVKACYVKRTGALRVIDSRKRCNTRTERALNWNQQGRRGLTGAAGAQGATGPQGGQGTPGPQGPAGPAGSPDTPAAVLAKLAQVDGAGSGVDADSLDGVDSADLLRANQVRHNSAIHNDNDTGNPDVILDTGFGDFDVIDDGDSDSGRTVTIRGNTVPTSDPLEVTNDAGQTESLTGVGTIEVPNDPADPANDNHLRAQIRSTGARGALECTFQEDDASGNEFVICTLIGNY